MPRRVMTEARFDFRGGRNTTTSPDLLNRTELVDAQNARLDVHGAFSKRTGSRRLHATAIGLGNPVRGLFQWDSPSGLQVVAIANGNLYHKTTAFGEFTEVIPAVGSEFSTTRYAHFATFRAAAGGSALLLFIASGGKLYKWTGSVLTRIDGVSNAPAADLLESYHTRLFAHTLTQPKHIFWSKVGDGEVWTTGGNLDGGTAMVDVLAGDTINELVAVGSSLLIPTADAIARFQGHSSDDIRVAEFTEGVSAEVGVVGEQALERGEQVVAFLSDRGPYFATEAGVTAIGQDVEDDFLNMDRTQMANVVVGHHRGRREVWYAYARTGDAGLNKSVLVFNYRLLNWCGPFTYAFGITSLARYEDANGSEWLIAGDSAGRVRHVDIGALDDVLADGTGGSTYTMSVELAPIFFETGPGYDKSLKLAQVQADLPAPSALQVQHAWDAEAFTTDATVTGVGGGVQSYRVFPAGVGKRLRQRFQDASSDVPIVTGVLLEAFDMQRPH